MMSILKIPVHTEDHIQGNRSAAITVVKYGDYQCPYCQLAFFVVKQLQEHFGPQMRFVFRNFPLKESHPLAQMAAETAEFAGALGYFWEMHDLIYENQAELSPALFIQLAESLGLSGSDLKISLEKQVFAPKIQSDFIGGVRSGVNGTPTFFINEERYNGPFQFEPMASAIESIFVQ